MRRRSLFLGFVATLAAPAVAKASSLLNFILPRQPDGKMVYWLGDKGERIFQFEPPALIQEGQTVDVPVPKEWSTERREMAYYIEGTPSQVGSARLPGTESG